MSDTSGDYLDPVVAQFLGENQDLLATIAESQGAMSEFASTAPELGQTSLPEEQVGEMTAGAEQAGNEVGAAITAGETEALNAGAPDVAAAASSGFEQLAIDLETESGAALEAAAATEQLGTTVEQTTAQTVGSSTAAVTMASEISRGGEAASSGAMSFQEYAESVQLSTQETQQLATWVGNLGQQLTTATAQMQTAEAATSASGAAADSASVQWMALAIAGAAVEVGISAGVLALSAAMVGAGYLIADFGGEAKGDLQQVEDAFRSTASEAAVAFQPAAQEITQTLVGMVQSVEQPMAEMFQDISGPAEDFFDGLASSVEQGMDAMVPAVEQMGPLIASISSDLGPLMSGIAGFIQEMAAAFEAAGGQQELAQLAQEIGTLLPVVGELTGEVGAGLLPIAEALTPVLQAVGNVLNALGPNFDTVVAGVLLFGQAWSVLTPLAALLDQGITMVATATAAYSGDLASSAALAGVAAEQNMAVAAAEAEEATAAEQAAVATQELAVETEASGVTAEVAGAAWEQLAIEFELEGAAAEEGAVGSEAASVAIAETGAVAEAASFSIGALALEFLPLLAVVVVGGLAAEELVQHWQDVANFFSQLGSDMFNFGANVVDGFAQGIESAWQTVMAPITDLIAGVKNVFTSDLGIASPSTVTREYGLNTGEGFALGLEDSRGLVHAGAATLATTATAALSGASAGAAAVPAAGAGATGSGATQVSVVINIGSTPFAVASAGEIEEVLMPVLQQLNLRDGQNMTSLPTVGGRT